MAPTFVVTSTTTRRHCAPQLNSGVRLHGNIYVSFTTAHAASKSRLDSSGQNSRSKRLPAIQKNASVRLKAALRRSKALVRRCGSGEFLGRLCSEFLCTSGSYIQSLGVGVQLQKLRLQPNKSFKLMSLRGADFCGSVYHNAAPLRATA